MAAGADAADAFHERPGIARVAAPENDLKPAPHRAGRDRVADHVVGVDVHLAAHMAFDAGDGIDDDAAAAVVEFVAVRRLNHGHQTCSLELVVGVDWRLVWARFSALTAA